MTSNTSWLLRWLPTISGVMGAQLLTQGLNAASGFIVVRMLPRESAYAWFTVASSMMAVISLLSDAGTGAAANALGGPVWQDRLKFTQIINAIMRYRRRLAMIAAGVALPWSVLLFARVHAPWAAIAWTVPLILAATWPATSAQILGSVNRLHSRYRPQLVADIASASFRLALTVAGLAPVFFWHGRMHANAGGDYPVIYCLVVSVAAACIPSFLNLWMVRKEAGKALLPDVAPTRNFDFQIKTSIRDIYPSTLFFCIQGQITTLLMSIFGSTAEVADIGALGRIGVIFAVIGSPVAHIAGPAFARCTSCDQLMRQFVRVSGVFTAFSLLILAMVVIAPSPILWLLGPQYSHLGFELRLTVGSLIIAGYSGITWGLATARGWVKQATMTIPLSISAQIAGLLMLDLSNVAGVLWFQIITTLPNVALACAVLWKGFCEFRKREAFVVT